MEEFAKSARQMHRGGKVDSSPQGIEERLWFDDASELDISAIQPGAPRNARLARRLPELLGGNVRLDLTCERV